MPPISEVRSTFTIDLNPFAAGLKTMLSMTQAAGKQITPLLNMQVKSPDYGVIDEQLKGLTKTVDDYLTAQVESAKMATTQTGAMGDLGGKTDDVEKKTRKAGDATEKHAVSLHHMKRESIETFGAISFLVQNLVQLADNAAGGDQKLEKLSRSMASGVSAGFGLASTMSLLGIATGGTAALIGAAVALGTSLLTFLSDAETRAKLASAAIDNFNRSLRGASTKDLESQRKILLDNIAITDKYIATLEKQRAAAAMAYGGLYGITSAIDAVLGTTLTGYGKVNKELDGQRDKRKALGEDLKKLDDTADAQMLTHVEAVKAVEALKLRAVQGAFEQRRATADQDLKRQLEDNQKIEAGTKERLDADRLAQKIHTDALKAIRDDELKAKDEHRKQMLEMDKEIALTSIDTDEKKAQSTAKTELERIAITETFALKRLAIEQEFSKQSLLIEKARLEKLGGPDQKRRIAEIDEELAKLAIRGQVMQQKIMSDSSSQVMAIPGMPPLGTIARQLQTIKDLEDEFNKETTAGRRQAIQQLIALENHKLDAMSMSNAELLQKERQTQEQRRQAWRETNQFQSVLIDSLSNGMRSMFGEVLMVHRQAANQWDAIWISMENTVIQGLAEIAIKQLENWLIDQALMAGAVAASTAAMTAIAASASAAATLVSIATFGGAAAIGAGAVLAALGTVKVASAVGFEKGGKTKKGEAGFIEGFYPEIIAPEHDFKDVMRRDLIPQFIVEHDRQLNVKLGKSMAEKMTSAGGGSGDPEILRTLRAIEEGIANLELQASFDNRGMKATLKQRGVQDKRIGLKN